MEAALYSPVRGLGSFVQLEDGTSLFFAHAFQHYTSSKSFPNAALTSKEVVHLIAGVVGFFLVRAMVFGTSRSQSSSSAFIPCRGLINSFVQTKRFIQKEKTSKFVESLWYTSWHFVSFIWGIYALYLEAGETFEGWPLFQIGSPTGGWYWLATPYEHAHLPGCKGWPLLYLSPFMRFYYVVQLAFWASCLVFVFFEPRRSDFIVMLTHHTVTLTLLIFSFIYAFWRIGLVILVLHDFGDILLYTTKCLHYANSPRTLVDTSFGLFTLAFFTSRLVAFPIYCLWPVLNIQKMIQITGGLISSYADIPVGYTFPLLLFLLLLLHIYWFTLILRMAMKPLAPGDNAAAATAEGDIRSDDEDSSEEPHKKAALKRTENKQKIEDAATTACSTPPSELKRRARCY